MWPCKICFKLNYVTRCSSCCRFICSKCMVVCSHCNKKYCIDTNCANICLRCKTCSVCKRCKMRNDNLSRCKLCVNCKRNCTILTCNFCIRNVCGCTSCGLCKKYVCTKTKCVIYCWQCSRYICRECMKFYCTPRSIEYFKSVLSLDICLDLTKILYEDNARYNYICGNRYAPIFYNLSHSSAYYS